VLPILTTFLGGVAARIGIGLAATAARRLFTRAPAPVTAEPRRTFAEELRRARPLAAGDAPLSMAASGLSLRSADGAAPRPAVEAPRLTTDPAQLALSTRAGRRRTGARTARFGRHQLGAYRRMDLGPR
jgi:hypothetical protein